jgi:flagellin
MVMRINSLGRGPLADRQLLGERQRKEREGGEGAPRQEEQDRFERRRGGSEQVRAEYGALNGAIRETEDALALAAEAAKGLHAAERHLATLERRLSDPLIRAAPAADGAAEVATEDVAEGAAEGEAEGAAAPPDWLGAGLAALDAVAETTRFGPQHLLDGSLGCTGVAVGDGLEFVGAGPETRSSPPQGYEVLLGEEPVRATVLGERALTPAVVAQGVRLLLREGTGRAALTTAPGQTAREVAEALQAQVRRAGLALLVEATGDGRLVVQHQLFGARHRFAVASSVPGVLSTPEGGPRIVANGRDIAGSLGGEPAQGEGQTLTGCADNVATAGLVVRYTGLPYTGATARLPRSRPAILEPRVFAGRVVVAQQALAIRLGSDPGEAIRLRLDSVRPAHLARGVANASGFGALAQLQARTPGEARDALHLVRRARDEVHRRHEALQALVQGRLSAHLARLRVQAQNLAAAAPEEWGPELRVAPTLAPGEARQAVQALSRLIRSEARSALTAQTQPSQGSVLGLLEEEQAHPGPSRWN